MMLMTAGEPTTDRQLIVWMECYADGDQRGFEELYRALAPMVFHCLRRWIGNSTQAEDLTQETFLRVHRARERYRRGAPVAPWVLTIARRLSIDHLRSRGAARVAITPNGELPETGVRDTRTDENLQELVAAVREAVAQLPDAQRKVVALHKLESQPMTDIAKALGITEQAARLKAHRGYKKLRVKLARLTGRSTNG